MKMGNVKKVPILKKERLKLLRACSCFPLAFQREGQGLGKAVGMRQCFEICDFRTGHDADFWKQASSLRKTKWKQLISSSKGTPKTFWKTPACHFPALESTWHWMRCCPLRVPSRRSPRPTPVITHHQAHLQEHAGLWTPKCQCFKETQLWLDPSLATFQLCALRQVTALL